MYPPSPFSLNFAMITGSAPQGNSLFASTLEFYRINSEDDMFTMADSQSL